MGLQQANGSIAAMGGFEFMDHTADVGIVATGKDLREAFAQAARGLFDFMADIDCVREAETCDVSVTAPDRDALLVAWLNELLFLCEVEHRYFSRFEIYEMEETGLKARCYGERFDADRHRLKSGVKSATYHILSVEDGNPSRVQVVLDV